MPLIFHTDHYLDSLLPPPQFSRGGFLLVAAAIFVAGCGLGQTSTASGLPTATLSKPPQVLTPTNASKIEQLTTLENGSLIIKSVAWAPNGRVLAAGVEGNIHLWDEPTHRWVSTLPGNTGQIYDMAWSRDSTRLVANWQGHSEVIFSVAWSPD